MRLKEDGEAEECSWGVWQYLRNFGQVPGRKWPSVGHFSTQGCQTRHGGVPAQQEQPGVHKIIEAWELGTKLRSRRENIPGSSVTSWIGLSKEACEGAEANNGGAPNKSEACRSLVGMFDASSRLWLTDPIFCTGGLLPAAGLALSTSGLAFLVRLRHCRPSPQSHRGAPLRGAVARKDGSSTFGKAVMCVVGSRW